MSTSRLYHAFGVRGYRYVRTDHQLAEVVFRIEQPSEKLRRPACGCGRVVRRGTAEGRMWKSVPIGFRAVWIFFAVPRVECRRCGVVRQVEVEFADPRRRCIRHFERYVLELLEGMKILDVATVVGLG